MTDSSYEDLLSQLDSDEPIKSSKTKRYEIEDFGLGDRTFSSEEIQGFVGFLASFLTSAVINNMTALIPAIMQGRLIESRFSQYQTLAAGDGHMLPSACGDLANLFGRVVRSAIDRVIEDDSVDKDISHPMKMKELMATLALTTTIVRAFDALSEEDRKKYPLSECLSFVVLLAFGKVGGIEELEETIKEMLEVALSAVPDVDNNENMLKDPASWLKAAMNGMEKGTSHE